MFRCEQSGWRVNEKLTLLTMRAFLALIGPCLFWSLEYQKLDSQRDFVRWWRGKTLTPPLASNCAFLKGGVIFSGTGAVGPFRKMGLEGG